MSWNTLYSMPLAYWWGGGAWGALGPPKKKLNHGLFSIPYNNVKWQEYELKYPIQYATGVLVGGGGGLGALAPPPQKKKLNHGLFSIPYKWLWYSTCRQVEISFLGMPQICTFSSRKMKKLPTVEGGNPHPPPARSLRSLWLGIWSLRSLAKIAPPPNVLAHYATAVCTRSHHFKLKSAKAPYRGRGSPPPPTPSPLN